MTTAAFIRERATAEHRSAARELATFLALFNQDAMRRLADALRRDLRSREAVCVAIAAIMAVDRHDLPEVLAVLEKLMPGAPAGSPETPFLLDPDFLLGAAELWAEAAWPQELWAYALAALARMSLSERAAIIRALKERVS